MIHTNEMSGKVWGWTQKVFGSPDVENWLIFVNPLGYCSKHQHEEKWNQFVLLQGRLMVLVWTGGRDPDKTFLIETGQSIVVPPRTLHRFVNVESTPSLALETYWVNSIRSNDIQRQDHGGDSYNPGKLGDYNI